MIAKIDRPVYYQRHFISADGKQGRSVSPRNKPLKPHKCSEQSKFTFGLFLRCHNSLSNILWRNFPPADIFSKRCIGITIQNSWEM